MSYPGVPEHVARNKYQAAQLRLGVTDAAQSAPQPTPFSPASAAAPLPFAPLNLPAATPTVAPTADTPAANSSSLYSAPGNPAALNSASLNTAPATPHRAGFQPRYSSPDPILTQFPASSQRDNRGIDPRNPMASLFGWGGEWRLWVLMACIAASFAMVRSFGGDTNHRGWALVLAAVVALGIYLFLRWKAKRVAQRRFDQVTRIRPGWSRHNAVSCRSLGVGVKRAGSVWLADDGTAKDLVLAWSRDGFEIYGGERSLTRIISVPWSEIVEVRTERAAVGQRKGQAGLSIVTRSNAVLTAALRTEPSGYRKFKSRTELAPMITQLRQFL